MNGPGYYVPMQQQQQLPAQQPPQYVMFSQGPGRRRQAPNNNRSRQSPRQPAQQQKQQQSKAKVPGYLVDTRVTADYSYLKYDIRSEMDKGALQGLYKQIVQALTGGNGRITFVTNSAGSSKGDLLQAVIRFKATNTQELLRPKLAKVEPYCEMHHNHSDDLEADMQSMHLGHRSSPPGYGQSQHVASPGSTHLKESSSDTQKDADEY